MADTAAAQGPITHARVLRIAGPIVLANISVPILGAVDTGVVGQLGEAAPIGAVGIGSVILTAIYWMFGFLRMGTTGLTSQAHGAGRTGEVAALLTRALIIAAAGGVALVALQWPIFAGAFMLAPTSDAVEELARAYMTIRIWSAPAMIATFGITGWLIALERTRAVLALQLWMNGLNAALSVWFVLGLGWGVEGVALATFLAEWSGLAMGLWLCRAALRKPAATDWPRVFEPEALKRMGTVNGHILQRSFMLEGIVVSFLFVGARFGDVTLAANQVLLQFLHFTGYALDGFAFAAEALVGQAVGARARARLRQAAILASLWGLIITALMALAFWFAGGWIIDIMTTSPEVRSAARSYLVWMALAPLLGLSAWMLDGIFIGATRTRDMRDMMAVSLVIYILAVLALIPLLGNHGLWVALLISYVARGLTLGARYPALERAAA